MFSALPEIKKPLLLMAPMEGVLDPILRQVLSQVGGVDRCVTEFIRVTDRLHPEHVFTRYAPELLNKGRTTSGTPVYVQLLGGQPTPMAENAARAAEIGAPGIDLNFGCPAKTVNRHDGGATLLKNPERIHAVVAAVRQAVPSAIPVTAKVRLGFSDHSLCVEIAQAAEAGGANELTVHGRTRDEMYRPPAHWEHIGRMREATHIRVIANGDIWTAQDYQRCRTVSGCPDVALGRGLVARPDLARQIAHGGPQLTWIDALELVRLFFKLNAEISGRLAVARLKQWCKFLLLTYPEASDLFERIKIHHDELSIRQVLEVQSQ